MKKTTTMVAVALLLVSGCGEVPEGSERANATFEENAAFTTLSTATFTRIPTIPLTPYVPTLTGSAVVGTGTAASCTETALNAALATAASITFNCGGPATITLTTRKSVAATQTIDGGGAITLDGNFQTRLFDVTTTGTLNLAHITLSQGFSSTTDGGAIANHGYLNLNDVTVRNNVLDGRVGAGLFTDGRNVKIENSRFLNNSAESGGAIAMGPAAATPGIQISNTQFTNNFGNGPAQGVGGAIWAAAGCLVVVDSAFTNNRAIQGGAIFTSPGVVLTIIGSPTTGSLPTAMQFNTNGAVSDGGAIFAFQSTASITNAAFSQNQTPPDQVLAGFGGAIVNLGGSMNISKGFFFKNGGRFGAALHSRANDGMTASLTIDRTTFLANTSAVFGGAMYLRGTAASAVITNSAFESNTAADAGGGIMRNDSPLRIENSSFTRNSAARGGGLVVSTLPGSPRGPYVRIQNVTFASNSATMGVGGVYNSASGVELYSTTIAANVGGGVLTDAGGNSRFRDTVLQNPGASNCALNTGTYSDDGANFATDTTCQFNLASSSQGTTLNPGLGALTQDPNGLTSFMKAGSLSPLLDRGLSCPTLDQIGATRIGACDIGAVESGSTPFGGNIGVLSR